jgi:hypothetical protein
MHRMRSSGEPIMGGIPALELGEVLTTSRRKKETAFFFFLRNVTQVLGIAQDRDLWRTCEH